MSATRASADREYLLDLCDEVIGRRSLRQHRFFFLRGRDGRKLPVAGFYPGINLAVEFAGDAGGGDGDGPGHREMLARRGVRLLALDTGEFARDARERLVRARERDLATIRQRLAEAMRPKPFRRFRREGASGDG